MLLGTAGALAPSLIHEGSSRLPPLVELPGMPLPLEHIVKPPSPEALYEWQCSHGLSDADPSWASLWPCAAALAAHLVSRPGLVADRRVVELGCGLGVTGLVAAKLGASTVTLVDREGLALQCAMATAERCGLSIAAVGAAAAEGTVRASAADWVGASLSGQAGDDLSCSLVLGAEVLYTPDEVRALASARTASGATSLHHKPPCEPALSSALAELAGAGPCALRCAPAAQRRHATCSRPRGRARARLSRRAGGGGGTAGRGRVGGALGGHRGRRGARVGQRRVSR